MYPVGLVAPDEEAMATLQQRLVDGLSAAGSVAAVRREEVEPPDHADIVARLSADGAWTLAGPNGSLTDMLDRLAPETDYAILTGFPTAIVPHIVVGEVDSDAEVLLRADSPAGVTVEGVLEALEGTEPYVTLESLVTEIKRSPDADRSGAIATFTGRVRERDAPDDRPTTELEFEKYEGIAEERLAALEAELSGRDGVQKVLMHHRTGVIPSGRDIVFVVVLAGHREEAFRTVEDGINRLKAEVPIFKKEVTVEEEFWVHERS
jgi:molybdopterin synthase catalytic subunit